MRGSSLVALARAALLVLLVGVLGTGAALAHHHDEGAVPLGSCGLCAHAASAVATTSQGGCLAPMPGPESLAPAFAPTTRDGRRTERRGRGPPVAVGDR